MKVPFFKRAEDIGGIEEFKKTIKSDRPIRSMGKEKHKSIKLELDTSSLDKAIKNVESINHHIQKANELINETSNKKLHVTVSSKEEVTKTSDYGTRPVSNGKRQLFGDKAVDYAAPPGTKIDEDKLLVIELDDINSIPIVHYNGKKISYLSLISMRWTTKEDSFEAGGASIEIKHIDESTRPGSIRKIGHERIV